MEYTTLGRTGLKVSVAGLGCGGFSKLGLGTGKSEDDAVALIRLAFDLGRERARHRCRVRHGRSGRQGAARRAACFGGGLHQGVESRGRKAVPPG